MKVLITGASKGIGLEIAHKFLAEGHSVIGLDKLDANSELVKFANYTHYVTDTRRAASLPDIDGIEILINNAGVQTDSHEDMDVNFMGLYHCTEKYGIQPDIKAIVNIASASAHNGAEFPLYAASKGAVLAYTKNVAGRVAQYGATCNSISPGGVTTETNAHIMDSPSKWAEVINETQLKKWATPEEIADWVYFIAITNKSMTAQDILVDNGEIAKSNFVW